VQQESFSTNAGLNVNICRIAEYEVIYQPSTLVTDVLCDTIYDDLGMNEELCDYFQH